MPKCATPVSEDRRPMNFVMNSKRRLVISIGHGLYFSLRSKFLLVKNKNKKYAFENLTCSFCNLLELIHSIWFRKEDLM